MMKLGTPFVLGLAIALLTHVTVGWWLNSHVGVVMMSLSSFAVATASGSTLYKAAALWFGLMSMMFAVLFWIGPGSVWPIVLVFGGAITAASVLAGMAVRLAIHRLRFR